MKHVNFLMVALMIIMGTTVTSCMNGEENTIVQGVEPMRVKDNIMGLSSFISGGIEVVPTNSTLVDLPSGTKIALVGYRYDRALQEITASTKKINVELLGKPQAIDAPLNICPAKDDVQDVKSTHAIATLSVVSGYSAIEPYVLPVMKGMIHGNAGAEYFLISPVGYKVKGSQKEDELKAELKKHSFTMIHYLDEVESGETSMVVYLRHVISGDDTTGDKVERTTNYAEYKAFDLTRAIVEFKKKSGVNPTKVIVKAMENTSSDDLKGANEKSYEKSIKIEE